MAVSRFEFLKQQLAKNPSDSRARYGLAMEHVSQGNLADALSEFRKLVETHPDHAPGYYHGGQTLRKLGRKDEALSFFRHGLLACDRMGDWRTKEELQAAIDVLGG